MTAQSLAEHLEVSERTIYRDIEALSFAGIPLYTERGPGGGCELLDNYQTRLTGLTSSEIRALFLLSSVAPLADLGLDHALDGALLKLNAALPVPSREYVEQIRQRIHVDTAQPTQPRPGISHLEILQEAIWQEHTLRLTYRGYHKHLFEPYGLVSQRGAWYLVGTSQGTMHIVCVAQIRAAELTEQHFIRSTAFDLASYWAERSTQANHASTGNRGGQRQKKAKMKTGMPTQVLSRNGTHTTSTRNKKNQFYFSTSSFPQKRGLRNHPSIMVA